MEKNNWKPNFFASSFKSTKLKTPQQEILDLINELYGDNVDNPSYFEEVKNDN